jgi:valyl-tRNA synthetase
MVPATDSRVMIVDGHAQAAGVPSNCPKCGGSKLQQDSDVLDTWFSSGLWPFSTLGWPEDTQDLREFYPTSLLISGYDILFFWDARMIMMGLHLTSGAGPAQRVPFRRLYLHSLVRTSTGAKMSKTKGTGVDPLELTQKFGTDALRYMLASMAAPGTDIILSQDRILGARAFANKVWNAARFLFVNLEKIEPVGISMEELAAPEIRARAPYPVPGEGALAHRWIFSRLSAISAQVNDALENFRFHEAAQLIYHFFWGDFCDWYIEWVKPQLTAADREIAVPAWRNIFAALEAALRLLHPVMPFLTEELWHRLPQQPGAKSIALQPFPEPHTKWADDAAERDMLYLQGGIVSARNQRADLKVNPKQKIAAQALIAEEQERSLVSQNKETVMRLASLSELTFAPRPASPSVGAAVALSTDLDIRIVYETRVDRSAEIARLNKEIERLAKDIESKRKRLADEIFRSKAPAEIVKNLESTLAERQAEQQMLQDRVKQLA